MESDRFSSLEELFNRVKPAIDTKIHELKNQKITYLKDIDIWNCLRLTKWKNTPGLTLGEMVDDILNIDIDQINAYLERKNHND